MYNAKLKKDSLKRILSVYAQMLPKCFIYSFACLIAYIASDAFARDIDYNNEEVSVYVSASEPTQVQFPGNISGGFKRKQSAVSLDKKGGDLILFAQENLNDSGEAIIVRLEDGRSFSIRVKKASNANQRDTIVKINDLNSSIILGKSEDEDIPFKDKNSDYAPPTVISGFMREMVLGSEFGKPNITGYKVSDRFKGDSVLNDGTISATIDKIYIGSSLWGYVIDAENLIDETQRLNPATFRLDGTRAISAKDWELAPRPFNVEQQIAGKHKTKVYIITKAR